MSKYKRASTEHILGGILIRPVHHTHTGEIIDFELITEVTYGIPRGSIKTYSRKVPTYIELLDKIEKLEKRLDNSWFVKK